MAKLAKKRKRTKLKPCPFPEEMDIVYGIYPGKNVIYNCDVFRFVKSEMEKWAFLQEYGFCL